MIIKAQEVPNSVGLAGQLSVSGVITKVFEKKSGNSDKGPWSFQNFEITDETGAMMVCLKNRSETLNDGDKNKEITISSSETKNGILGVKIERSVWKDKKDGNEKSEVKVVVTKSASLVMKGEGAPTLIAETEVSSPVPVTRVPVSKKAESEYNAELSKRQTILHAVSRTLIGLQGAIDINNVYDVSENLYKHYLHLIDDEV